MSLPLDDSSKARASVFFLDGRSTLDMEFLPKATFFQLMQFISQEQGRELDPRQWRMIFTEHNTPGPQGVFPKQGWSNFANSAIFSVPLSKLGFKAGKVYKLHMLLRLGSGPQPRKINLLFPVMDRITSGAQPAHLDDDVGIIGEVYAVSPLEEFQRFAVVPRMRLRSQQVSIPLLALHGVTFADLGFVEGDDIQLVLHEEGARRVRMAL